MPGHGHDDYRVGLRAAAMPHLRRVALGVSTTGSHIRTAAGRRFIATGRRLSRVGARLLRHPSARPPLRLATDNWSRPATDAANVYDIRRGAL